MKNESRLDCDVDGSSSEADSAFAMEMTKRVYWDATCKSSRSERKAREEIRIGEDEYDWNLPLP